ncbi:transmembrane protein 273 isoform X10 [Macaca nemestrina]|uniref:transmembrane protein 273 isoform X10 n=2 Tax=Macaca TaxID=9539 RepID=UPI0039B825C4
MAHCACVARSQESGAEQSANMNLGVSMLRILFLLDVGGAQVLATGKPPGAEIDFKYALIGTAVGIAVSASFLALKICMIRRHLFDDDSSDLKSTPGGLNDTIPLKKRAPRRNHNFFERHLCCPSLPSKLVHQVWRSLTLCNSLQFRCEGIIFQFHSHRSIYLVPGSICPDLCKFTNYRKRQVSQNMPINLEE